MNQVNKKNLFRVLGREEYYDLNAAAIERVRARHGAASLAFIETFGCQMNEHDTEHMYGMLLEMGYSRAQSYEDADVVILNTCCVRENAENRVYGNLGWLKHLKESKPGMIIGICGCMMQRPHIVEHIRKKFPFVNLIFGTHNLYSFPVLLDAAMANAEAGRGIYVNVMEKADAIPESMPLLREKEAKAYVNITFGCNNYCTYCIVPYTRGRERSRSADSIVEEVKRLVASGAKEVMLLGQNVNSYGKELGTSFAELLRRIDTETGIERIRFMTPHPKDIDYELINVIAGSRHVCKQLHLPLQSGSDKVLKEMNRSYNTARYAEIVEYARAKVPGIAVSTDLIVGFPGETEEDFKETLEFVKKMDYDSAYTYIYSPREGTPAAKFKNQVPDDIKSRRLTELVDMINERVKEKMKDYVGTEQRILIEGVSNRSDELYMGRTDGFITCTIPREGVSIGDMVDVKIVRARNFSLVAEKIAKG